MATAEEIQEVQWKLDTGAGPLGWNEARIESFLDNGRTANSIAAEYWEYRMNNSTSLANVSESGSSRSLSAVYDHIKDQALRYRKLADAEEEQEAPSNSSRSREMRRV